MKHLLVLCVALVGLSISIQAADITFSMRQNYIQTYGEIAIQEMHRSGIPASIILAQGILESQWGQGELAKNGNNHFGIKCHDWNGHSYQKKDDDYVDGELVESCFRVYQSALKSYEDHTDFLLFRDRYRRLFSYDQTDYVNWAYGLKECGYATDSRYPEKLIRIIQENGLDKYDKKGSNNSTITNNEYLYELNFEFDTPSATPSNIEEPTNEYYEETETEEELIWEYDEEYVEVSDVEFEEENDKEENYSHSYIINNKNSYKNRIQQLHRTPSFQGNRR
jgi:hypothetical protein